MNSKSNELIQKDPFFIFYDTRSGSTFLSNLLIKSACIAIPPESNFITKIILLYNKDSISNKNELHKVLDIIRSEDKFEDWNIDIDLIEKEIENRLPVSVRALILLICAKYKDDNFPEADIFGIKKGSYVNFYRKIKEIFPESKFIGIIRDGRAVFNSKKNSIRSETGKPFETDPYRAAKQWRRAVRLLKKIEDEYQDILIIKYEEIVKDTVSIIEKVCDYLDIPYNSENTADDRKYYVSEKYGDIHKNINEPPDSSRITAWRQELTEKEIYVFESITYKELIKEGYELVNREGLLRDPIRKVLYRLKHFMIDPERRGFSGLYI
ncbi:sulfotransferase [Elusimicrobiota bacterium]